MKGKKKKKHYKIHGHWEEPDIKNNWEKENPEQWCIYRD